MTGEKGGLLAGLRAEALKSRHAAPVRLAVLMALPMPLLGAMPYRGVQIFSAWNYWYTLFLPGLATPIWTIPGGTAPPP